MEIAKYLTDKEDSLMLRFCYTGGLEKYIDKLKNLISLAEPEKWSYKGEKIENSILFYYIQKTFEKVAKENKVLVNDDESAACFNTGLLTPYGEDIICVFTKMRTPGELKWYLDGFYADSDWTIIEKFAIVPEVATYFNNDSELLFDAKADIRINYSHILDDHFEERFPEHIRSLGKQNIISAMKGSIDITRKRILRNHRIVIPLFYKDKITYLLPVTIYDYRAALVVEKISQKQYRANTIFTLDMAYSDARLLMKPETDWLILE